MFGLRKMNGMANTPQAWTLAAVEDYYKVCSLQHTNLASDHKQSRGDSTAHNQTVIYN